jgi:hypothetical protein
MKMYGGEQIDPACNQLGVSAHSLSAKQFHLQLYIICVQYSPDRKRDRAQTRI